MMKNRQILFLCLALCATLTSFAQTTFTVDGLDYEVISTNPNEVKLTGGTPATTTLNIPASVIDNGTTYSVTIIGFAAFGFDDTGDVSPSTITALTIPNTITVIEDFAFNSNQITGAVTIPNSVTTLGVFLFRGNEITSASLPNTLSAIPTGIFEENLLTSITLPDTVVSIGKDAFADNFLTSITIPDSVTSIEEDAFFSNNLMSITIPDSVTSIGDEAFEGNNLTNLIIPSSVTVIGGAAFGLNPITAVTALGNTAPSMMISAFSDVTAATLFIPQNTLEDYVANGWSVFGTIVAGDTTFESAFTVNGFNFLVTSLVPSEVTVLGQEGTLTSIDIPATVSNAGTTYNITEISSNAFRDNNLTALTLPNTLREINFAAFEGNALTTLVIPNSVTALGSLVFDNNAISELTLGTSITTISNFSFRNNQLTNVTIPSAVTTVFGGAFINNPLATVTVEGIEPPSVNTSDNFDSFSNRSSIDLLIPEGTTQAYLDGGWTGFNSINGVFVGFEFEVNGLTYRITSLNSLEVAVTGGTSIPTDLVLPEVVPFEGVNFTLVGADFRAFDAEGLDSVILPNTLRNIGDFAFENNGMPSVEIPEGVETINFRSFRGNTLTAITIPSTVTSIAQDAFANNPLQTVTALGTIPAAIETLTFGDRSGIDLFIPEGTLPAYINAGWIGFASVTEITINITVAPKVFLQGASLNPIAGEEDLMRDSLRENGLLPTISPYGDGATVNPTVFTTTGANAIVDWVRVELRTGVDSDNTTIVNSKAALLQRDGDIVDLDGSSNITFTEEDGDYFIAIIHRNHIGILAAVPAPLSNQATALDFTQDVTSAKGENLALTTLVNGTFAMIAGDADGSSQILNTDITEGLLLAGGGQAYSTADADMNGFVLNSDIQLLILGNSGTVQQFE